jgi:hypothetical protein
VHKKIIKGIKIAATCLMVALGCGGCDLSTSQIKQICQQAGLFSAIGWIAVDNPTAEVKHNMLDIVKLVKVNATNVTAGQSYSDVIYPIVVKYATTGSTVDPQYQNLVLAGSAAILGGIDMMFSAHPDWQSNSVDAISYVASYCDGAIIGLNMADSDPIMRSARKTTIMRSKAMLMRPVQK